MGNKYFKKISNLYSCIGDAKDTLIGDLMTCINSLGLSIASINAVNTPDLQTIVKLKVLTSNLNELNNLIVNMKKLKQFIILKGITNNENCNSKML